MNYILLWILNLFLLLSSFMQDQQYVVKFPASTMWAVDIDIIVELQVAIFVVLAMTLRRKPDVLISLLPIIKENPKYQGQDKLPVTIWVITQVKLQYTIAWMDVSLLFVFLVVLNQDSTIFVLGVSRWFGCGAFYVGTLPFTNAEQ